MTFDSFWFVAAGVAALAVWVFWSVWPRARRDAGTPASENGAGRLVDGPADAADSPPADAKQPGDRRTRERRLNDRRGVAAGGRRERRGAPSKAPLGGFGITAPGPVGGRRSDDRPLPGGGRRSDDVPSPGEPATPLAPASGGSTFLPTLPAVTRIVAPPAQSVAPALSGAPALRPLPVVPAALPSIPPVPERSVTRVLALERASAASWAAAAPVALSAIAVDAVSRALPRTSEGHHALAFADDAALRIARGDVALMRSMAAVHRFAASDRAWLDAPSATSVCGQVLSALAESRWLAPLAGEVAALRIEAERSNVAGALSVAVVRLLHDARAAFAVALRSQAYHDALERSVRDARASLAAQRTLAAATANALRARLAAERRDAASAAGAQDHGVLDLAHRLLAERRSEAMVLRSLVALDRLRSVLGGTLAERDDELAASVSAASAADRALVEPWPSLRQALDAVHAASADRCVIRREAIGGDGWRVDEASAMLFEIGPGGRVAAVRVAGFGAARPAG